MKLVTLLLALSFSGLNYSLAEDNIEILSTIYEDSKTKETLVAGHDQVKVAATWEFELNLTEGTLKNLLTIARAKLPLGDQKEIRKLSKVEWRRTSFCWVATFCFLTGRKGDARSPLDRGDEGVSSITLLPNGTIVKVVTTPLSSTELEALGLSLESEKRPKSGEDPFKQSGVSN